MTSTFGGRVGQLLLKYLGLSLCTGVPKCKLWDPVMEIIDRKLSAWKGKYLLLGGMVTLIKSILSRIPMYYLSCFKCPCPKDVVKRIGIIQHDFLWNDSVEKEIIIWLVGM